MERKNITVRVKKVVVDRLKLLSQEDDSSFQKTVDEILELGILEKLKGGYCDEKRLHKRTDRDIK